MLALIWWMLIGLLAGGLARMLIPGRQSMGLLLMMVLGLAGSVVGGFISSMIFNYDPVDPGFHVGGLMMSTIGAILVLAISVWSAKQRISP